MQRRRCWLFLLAGAIALPMTAVPHRALADSAPVVKTVVDGREITYADVHPFIQADRTLVPMRRFLEALGAEVSWEPATRTAIAQLGETEVRATIGEQTALVDDQPVPLDVPAQIVEDRTVIPLRFFAESLGLAVRWDPEAYTVLVDTRRARQVSRDGADRPAAPADPEDPTASDEPAAPAEPDEPMAPEQPAAPDEPPAPSPRDLVVERATALIGLPYAWGGTSPETGFDCSGLIYYLAGLVGVEVPRTSFALYEVGTPIARDQLHAGDLVFFTTYAPGASHVGIYDGNGAFIHAQSEGTGVQRTPLEKDWWAARYLGARRIFE